jgi:membrane-bound lytic murein transglycosylase A
LACSAFIKAKLAENPPAPSELIASKDVVSWSNTPDYQFNKLGKYIGNVKLPDTYTLKSLKSFKGLTKLDDKAVEGLNNQLRLLQYHKSNKPRKYGNLTINQEDTKKTVELLLKYGNTPNQLLNMLDAHQLIGNDNKGNVYQTGYFTPVLKVSRVKDGIFKYPIYTRPTNWKGKLPSRKEIEGDGVLDGKGLVLAYANDPVEVYFMQVQGSGIVEYTDGTRELFSYNGNNGHPYKSIGKFMVREGISNEGDVSIKGIKNYIMKNPEMKDSILFTNPSYVFFTPVPTKNKVKGDPDFIPLGSCLLGAVPVINRKGICIGHEFKLLLAQDVGGIIKGPGHIDIYRGLGYEGRMKAGSLHHYGALWLLLPKAEPGEPEVIRAAM